MKYRQKRLHCNVCNKETLQTYHGRQDMRVNGNGAVLDLYNCRCGGTSAVVVPAEELVEQDS